MQIKLIECSHTKRVKILSASSQYQCFACYLENLITLVQLHQHLFVSNPILLFWQPQKSSENDERKSPPFSGNPIYFGYTGSNKTKAWSLFCTFKKYILSVNLGPKFKNFVEKLLGGLF